MAVCKWKDDSFVRGSYRAVKLTDHPIRVPERFVQRISISQLLLEVVC